MSSPPSFCPKHEGQILPCSICARQKKSTAGMPVFTDRDLAIVVRAALLAIVAAIEKRYGIKKRQVE